MKIFQVVPGGLRDVLKSIKSKYNNPEIYITEIGLGEYGSELNDTKKKDYFDFHLRELSNAMMKDNCNITLFCVWSIMDNFEWSSGYR